ncbi:hypothetical protein DFQ28_006919 [Apophysomyces sp. BC1034]|nr:hypothetical protein DFQ30_006799 [Apophysomyces sp. BC1015]KAG0176696.1 hypothetical protein DFQ29_005808 [Apophysomyces sp. BC1021]KAG0187068.1 hypothetical protein DFQ28_006919 [Apophysomyces sp. BC1034]
MAVKEKKSAKKTGTTSEIDDIFSGKKKTSAASEIDDIFSKKKAPKTDKKAVDEKDEKDEKKEDEEDEEDEEDYARVEEVVFAELAAVKRSKKRPAPAVKEDDDFADSRGKKAKRLTDDGYPLYDVKDLRIGEGGDTPDCPFDCQCCF